MTQSITITVDKSAFETAINAIESGVQFGRPVWTTTKHPVRFSAEEDKITLAATGENHTVKMMVPCKASTVAYPFIFDSGPVAKYLKENKTKGNLSFEIEQRQSGDENKPVVVSSVKMMLDKAVVKISVGSSEGFPEIKGEPETELGKVQKSDLDFMAKSLYAFVDFENEYRGGGGFIGRSTGLYSSNRFQLARIRPLFRFSADSDVYFEPSAVNAARACAGGREVTLRHQSGVSTLSTEDGLFEVKWTSPSGTPADHESVINLPDSFVDVDRSQIVAAVNIMRAINRDSNGVVTLEIAGAYLNVHTVDEEYGNSGRERVPIINAVNEKVKSEHAFTARMFAECLDSIKCENVRIYLRGNSVGSIMFLADADTEMGNGYSHLVLLMGREDSNIRKQPEPTRFDVVE